MQLQLDPNKTYAIALEGGGARGAYEIGVWKALKEAGIRFDAVAGTSVGALNGAMMAVGDLEKAVTCWENIRLSQVIRLSPEEETRLGNLLKGKNDPGESLSFQDLQESLTQISEIVKNRGLDISPLRSWIAQIIDTAGLKASPVELYVTTVNLSDKKTQEIRIRDVPEEQICDMLMASAYHPTFRQEKLGGKYYADGGFFDTLPLHALTASGHKDIIAIRLPSAGMERIFRLPSCSRSSYAFFTVMTLILESAARVLIDGSISPSLSTPDTIISFIWRSICSYIGSPLLVCTFIFI